MNVVDNETLSSIIGDIYDCVLNPDGWPDVLIRVTQTLDAAYTTIALAGTSDNHGRFAAQSPWDPERMRALQDYSFDDIPGLKAAVVGDIDTPLSTLSIMSESELQQTPFFQNWAGPQGLRAGCITKFVHTPDRIGLLGVTTWADRDIVTAEDQRFLALLSPHLRRAALIGDLLDNMRVTTHLFRDTLQSLAVPVVLTDSEGAILYANTSAERMFAAGGPILRQGKTIQAQNPSIGGALLQAIASAASDVSLGSKGIGLPVSATGKPPAVAYVLPLTQGTARAAFQPACAAVFVSTTTSASPLPEAVLTTLFELTPAEARVLVTIGGGMSPSKSAVSLGVSENTLKTHLNRIYAKTGRSRQADLVKLVSEIGTPLAILD
ncbi:MAG: LuxR family transcriptional regulator [Afipia sp.]|nr:LuxR family transcriptional regulator [Afipia sp.]